MSEKIENNAKGQNGPFLNMLCKLNACLLGNLLTDKGKMRAGKEMIRAGGRTIRASQDF